MPLMAEWTRGSAGGPSGLSIGFTPNGEHEPPGPNEEGHQDKSKCTNGLDVVAVGMRANDIGAEEQAKSIAQSQFATLMSGSQGRETEEEAEEGTVQVANNNNKSLSGKRDAKRRLSNEEIQQALSSADAQLAEIDTAHVGNHSMISNVATKHLKRNDSSMNGDLDSLSAISKAVREDSMNQPADHPTESKHNKREDVQMQDSIKPTESLSSAAAGVFPGSYAAAMATAASLVSQNTGRVMAREDRTLRKSLSGEIAIDTNDALNMLNAVGAATHMKSPRVAPERAAQSANQRTYSRMAPAVAQNAPGNSSNSGNHHVTFETYQNHLQGSVTLPKRNKSFSSSKPPMRPPPKAATAIATVAPAAINTMSGGRGVNVALPTGSSTRAGGIQIQLDQLAHMAEDAVSTVQQQHELLGEVACDAVSKASADARVEGGQNNEEYTESVIRSVEDVPVVNRRVTRAMARRNNSGQR